MLEKLSGTKKQFIIVAFLHAVSKQHSAVKAGLSE